jgi:hypothetical protein
MGTPHPPDSKEKWETKENNECSKRNLNWRTNAF